MSTIRIARRNRYTAVDRRAINDPRLSFRARGVLVWLLDKPDDWSITRDGLMAAGPEGQHAMRTALKELTDHGYLARRRHQNDAGQWVTETLLFEIPPDTLAAPPVVENRPSENRPSENRPVDTNTEQKTELKLIAEAPAPAKEKGAVALVLEALLATCGITEVSRSAAGGYGKAASDIAAVGGTPAEVLVRAQRYARKWPNMSLTPNALARHWGELGPESAPRQASRSSGAINSAFGGNR